MMAKTFGKTPVELMRDDPIDFAINKLIFSKYIEDDLKYQATLAGAKMR